MGHERPPFLGCSLLLAPGRGEGGIGSLQKYGSTYWWSDAAHPMWTVAGHRADPCFRFLGVGAPFPAALNCEAGSLRAARPLCWERRFIVRQFYDHSWSSGGLQRRCTAGASSNASGRTRILASAAE
jgi:hypothetical protein